MSRSSGRGNNARSVARVSRGPGGKQGPRGFVKFANSGVRAGTRRSGTPGGRNIFAPNAGRPVPSVKGPSGARRLGGVAIKSLNAQGPIGRGGVGAPRRANTGIASRRARASS